MELRHVRYFAAVAEERNFTRAAARLNIAQSPLSQQIRQLERDLGVQLFVRTTRSVALTYAGQVFYERITGLLAASEDAIDAARKADRGDLGSLAVGFTGSATYELLPTLVRAYADRHPEVTLEVHSDMMTPHMGVALVPASLRHLRINGVTFRPLRSPRVTTSLALAYRDTDVNPLVRLFLDVTRTVVRSRNAVETPKVVPADDDYRFTLDF